jgi:hypothetical protein
MSCALAASFPDCTAAHVLRPPFWLDAARLCGPRSLFLPAWVRAVSASLRDLLVTPPWTARCVARGSGPRLSCPPMLHHVGNAVCGVRRLLTPLLMGSQWRFQCHPNCRGCNIGRVAAFDGSCHNAAPPLSLLFQVTPPWRDEAGSGCCSRAAVTRRRCEASPPPATYVTPHTG